MNGFGPFALRKKVNGRVNWWKRMGMIGSPCAIDDVKPVIVTMKEFLLVDRASLLFKKASECELHKCDVSK